MNITGALGDHVYDYIHVAKKNDIISKVIP